MATSEITMNRIPMVLHCPRCGTQHIDEATAEWDNPPHRSHACQKDGCGCIWRPADVPTTGVATISTKGKSDNWAPGDTTLADRWARYGTATTWPGADRPLNMCAHGADQGTYCGQCGGYSQGNGMTRAAPRMADEIGTG